MTLTFTEHPKVEPQALILTRQLGRLTEQVQTILEQTRVLRERTIATRQQVQQSADSRRARRAATAPRPQRAAPGMLMPLQMSLAGEVVEQVVGHAAVQAPPTPPAPMLSVLTKRMREILALLVQGKSEKEVATHLGLSPHTVHIHVTRMYARLCVNSRAELLARFYLQDATRRAS